MSAAMPDRKPLSTPPATMLDILETTTEVRHAGEYESGEEQTPCPGTAEVSISNIWTFDQKDTYWFMLPLDSFAFVVPLAPQYGQSTTASICPRSRRGIGVG
jgi:hypothetical protein